MLTIRKGTEVLKHSTFTFPGGEIGVKLDVANYRYRELIVDRNDLRYQTGGVLESQTITARLQNSADLMELVMVTDALRRWDPTPIKLVLPYVPYGRQDRVCVHGEAFSLKAFADLINSLGFTHVITFDPHSDVTAAVLDRVETINQLTILGRWDELNGYIVQSAPVLVSPDAGANKKTAELAGHYGHASFLRADKLRDLATGKIKEIVVVNPREDVEGRDCLIVDDLLDKGGTFLGLAKALVAKGARSVELYCTHGLFTADLGVLLASFANAGIRRLWVTNSYRTDLAGQSGMLKVLDLDTTFLL